MRVLNWHAFTVVLLLALPSVAQVGMPASPEDFGPNTRTETFEDQVQITVPQAFIPFDGGTLPFGYVSPGYTFPSGVSLTGASPQPDTVQLYDWEANPIFYNQVWFLGLAGHISGATELPSWSGFLAHDNLDNNGALELTLPVPAYRVGAYVQAWEWNSVSLGAFDATGALVGLQTVNTDGGVVTDPIDALDCFVGVQSERPIVRVKIRGPNLALDDLMFDPDSALHYGTGCPGTAGLVPQLTVAGAFQAGAALSIEVSQGLPGSRAYLLAGDTQAQLPFGGTCNLLIDPILTVTPINLDANGYGSHPLNVPVTAPLGDGFTMQAWVLDAASPAGASSTNGVQVTVIP